MLISGFVSKTAAAQGEEVSFLKAGVDLHNAHFDSLALIQFERIIHSNSDHLAALVHAARVQCNLGGRSNSLSVKKERIQKAMDYATRTIALSSINKEAHLTYIIALGLSSEVADKPSEKLKSAYIIKDEADLLLTLDSLYPPAHFALGKWHLSLASLSWYEKLGCNILLGGMPQGASYEMALLCFERAIQLQPACILFYYNKALALQKMGRLGDSLETLHIALNLPLQEPDDTIRKKKCIALIKEIEN